MRGRFIMTETFEEFDDLEFKDNEETDDVEINTGDDLLTHVELLDGLTFKQWTFCEEYLQNFNALDAYRKAYGKKTHNAANTMKSKKVQAYIKKRLKEKMATMERLEDLSNSQLKREMESGNVEAIKIFKQYKSKADEVAAKLEEKENPPQQDVNIKISYEDA